MPERWYINGKRCQFNHQYYDKENVEKNILAKDILF